MAPVVYPDWVPPAVRKEADWMLAPVTLLVDGKLTHLKEDEDCLDLATAALVRRMTTAPTMKPVWRRVQKYLAGSEHQPAGSVVHDACLGTFFRGVCISDLGPDDADLAGAAAEVKEDQRVAAYLRQRAEENWFVYAEEEDDAKALFRAAELLEQSAEWKARQLQQVPGEKLRGRHPRRDYAIRVADLACLFEIPDGAAWTEGRRTFPYTLIAAVVVDITVGAGVSHKHVEHWIKRYVDEQRASRK
jgi:hypothetical protein